MAQQKTYVPDPIKPYLVPSRDAGTWEVRNWVEWFQRPIMKMGRVVITAAGSDNYHTRVIGVHVTNSGIETLMVQTFVPEPPADFWIKQPAILFQTGFVEGGYAVYTSFRGVAKREINFEGQGGVELDNIFLPKVTVQPYELTLPARHNVRIKMKVLGEMHEVKPTQISITNARFKADLPDDVPEEGFKIEKAVISAGDGTPPIPLTGTIFEGEGEQYEGHVKAPTEDYYKQLAQLVDNNWMHKAQVLIRREKDAHRRMLEDASGAYKKNLHKTHFFLLSDDDTWEEKLGKYGIVRRIEDVDFEYVHQELTTDRNDLIIVDADLWAEDSIDLARSIQQDKELNRTPLFWFASKESPFLEEKRLELINRGAYDVIDPSRPAEEVARELVWALKHSDMGEGPEIAIITPDLLNMYRLGIALYRSNYKLVKSLTRDNPVSGLNPTDVEWVIIDANGFGKNFPMILKGSLAWARKHKDKGVILLAPFVDKEKAKQWLNEGLVDIIKYKGGDEKEVAERVHNRIKAFAPKLKAAKKAKTGKGPKKARKM
ncbi:hypothetical protein GF324_02020 [bacterium]|nr:hypothetical protein [bacterium]